MEGGLCGTRAGFSVGHVVTRPVALWSTLFHAFVLQLEPQTGRQTAARTTRENHDVVGRIEQKAAQASDASEAMPGSLALDPLARNTHVSSPARLDCFSPRGCESGTATMLPTEATSSHAMVCSLLNAFGVERRYVVHAGRTGHLRSQPLFLSAKACI